MTSQITRRLPWARMAQREPMESDIQVRDLLVQAQVKHAVVATKADKLSKGKVKSDKRHDLKARDQRREMERAMKRYRT